MVVLVMSNQYAVMCSLIRKIVCKNFNFPSVSSIKRRVYSHVYYANSNDFYLQTVLKFTIEAIDVDALHFEFNNDGKGHVGTLYLDPEKILFSLTDDICNAKYKNKVNSLISSGKLKLYLNKYYIDKYGEKLSLCHFNFLEGHSYNDQAISPAPKQLKKIIKMDDLAKSLSFYGITSCLCAVYI